MQFSNSEHFAGPKWPGKSVNAGLRLSVVHQINCIIINLYPNVQVYFVVIKEERFL